MRRVGNLTVAIEQPAGPRTRPPILLIHGMFGGAWQWERYQSLLAERGYETHAINLRGHHGSRPVADIGKVTLAQFVDDALEVADTLDRPIVMGHSMGGLIAQKVAERGRTRALVLVASAPPRWIPPVSWLLLRKQLKYMRALLLFEPLLPKRADADVLMFNRTPLPDRDEQYPQLVPESGRAGFELSVGVEAVHAPRITAPVLVLTGTDDRFVVPRVAHALANKYRATLKVYPSFAHHIIVEPGWEKPCEDIVHWLEQTASASAHA